MRTAFANRRTLAPSRDPTARGACLVVGRPYAAAQRVYADAVGGGSQRSPTDVAPQTGKLRGVTIGITAGRAQQLEKQCQRLLAMGAYLPRAEIRRLAGLASWLAGLMPQLGAFTRRLWAASYSGVGLSDHRKQVQLPLRCVFGLSKG